MKIKVPVFCAVAAVMSVCGFAETWDVVVIGGTARAVQTAVAVKREGAKTLLVAPRLLLSDDVAGQLRLDAYENPLWEKLPNHFKLKRKDVTNYPFATFTPNSARGSLLQDLQTNGVPFRTGTAVTAAEKGADGLFTLETWDRAGRGVVRTKAVVDATGFTPLAESAGVAFAPFKPGRHRFVRYVLNGRKPSAKGLEVKEFQNDYYAVIAGWDVKAPTNFPGSFKAQLYRCTWETELQDLSPLSLAKLDAAFRDLTFGPLQADAGDEFFAEQPLRPLVSDAAAAKKGYFWCADDAAAKGCAAKAAAFAKTAKPGAAEKPAADAWPVLATVDVVVAGGGTCGAPAAIAAARAGAKVAVCEFYFNLGGTQTTGLLGSYWDGNRVGFTPEIDAGCAKLGSIRNQTKAEYYRREIERAGGVVFYGMRVVGAVLEGKDAKGRSRVTGVKVVTADGRKGIVRGAVVIDATGNADVAAAAGAPTVFGAQRPEAPILQGTSISWRDIATSVSNCEMAFVDDRDPESIRRALWQTAVSFGPTYRWDLAPFVGSRERRRIVGDFVVRTHDMARGKTYRDTVTLCKAGQDSHGSFSDEMLFFTTISGGKKLLAPVPYRAFFPKGLSGLLVTGLGLSAERDTLAVMRMQADLQNEGYAAGRAAAMAALGKVAPDEIDVRALQRHLVEKGILDASVLTDVDTPPLDAAALAALVPSVVTNGNLNGLWEFYAAGETGRKVVAEAAAKATWKPGTPEARNFALFAAAMGVKGHEEELVRFLATEDPATTNVWDKGRVSFLCYGPRFSWRDEAIIGLAKLKYRPFAPQLAKMLARLEPDVKGKADYSHLRAVAIYLDAVPEKSCAKELARILAAIRGNAQKSDDATMKATNLVRVHDMLRELVVARALYRLGDEGGLAKEVLESYLSEPMKVFSDFARNVLRPQS